jgi:hypothetical protein
VTLDIEDYTRDEISILQKINNKFGGLTSREISDYYNKETLGLDTDNKSIIELNRTREMMEL